MQDKKSPLDIIKEIGIFNLWDGEGCCPCGEFYIKGIRVKIHCWRCAEDCGCKYSGVHIENYHDINYSKKELTNIGKEVKKQIEKIWGSTTEFALYIEKE